MKIQEKMIANEDSEQEEFLIKTLDIIRKCEEF